MLARFDYGSKDTLNLALPSPPPSSAPKRRLITSSISAASRSRRYPGARTTVDRTTTSTDVHFADDLISLHVAFTDLSEVSAGAADLTALEHSIHGTITSTRRQDRRSKTKSQWLCSVAGARCQSRLTPALTHLHRIEASHPHSLPLFGEPFGPSSYPPFPSQIRLPLVVSVDLLWQSLRFLSAVWTSLPPLR